KLGLAAVLALLAAAVVVTSAQAHGKLVRSEPADGSVLAQAPSQLRLWFNESIDRKLSSLQVADEDGQAVEVSGIGLDPADDTSLLASLPELSTGVYTVTWEVLTPDDGHVTKGTVVFGIGAGVQVTSASAADTSPVPLLEVFLKWLHFSLMAVLVGSLAIVHLVLNPRGKAPATRKMLEKARRRTLGWAALAGGAALVVGVALLLVPATSLADGSVREAVTEGVWWQVLSQSRLGMLWLAREGAILALTLAVLFLRRGVQVAAVATVVLAPVLVTAQALNSHAAALTENSLPAVAADALHLLAASFWVGGLFALIVAFLPLMRSGGAQRLALARAGWRRFSVLAALSLGVLLVTGLYSTARQVASPDALLTTLYGQVLMGKMGLVLIAGAFGLLNSLLLHPRLAAPLARLLRRPAGWTPLNLRRLPALVLAEAGLGLLIFLAAGLITSVAPARGPEFEPPATAEVPSFLSQPVDDLTLTLSARPNKPGQNIFTVGVLNSRRPPPAEIQGVTLRFTPVEADQGPVSAEAEEVSPG
ncbi:MAG: copper resistance CopC/CopD family protein, partial [Dehalococcoidia bacterium]